VESDLQDDLQQAQKAQFERRFDEADRMYRKAVADAGKLPPKDPRVATTLIQYAGVYEMQRRPAEAEPLLMRALAAAENNSGTNSPEAAEVLASITQHYLFLNKNLDAAEKYAQRNFDIRNQIPGMADPNLTAAIDLLGEVHTMKKEYSKAEPLFQRSLSITEHTQGPDDPSVAVSLDHLAALYNLSGQFPKAEAVYRRIIAIEEKAHGANSRVLLGSLAGLSEVLRNEGRGAEAMQVEARRNTIAGNQQRNP
jgi:tetratricopeptide (TPR) repeat protein